MNMNLKTEDQTRYDAMSMGEVLLRLDPGDVPSDNAGSTNVAAE